MGRRVDMKKLQIILFVAILAVVGFFAWKFIKWDRSGNADAGEEYDTGEEFDIELADQIFELSAADLKGKKEDGTDTILCLGNDSFAWDYDNGLSRVLAEKTGAEVRNGAFPGSTITDSDEFSFVNIARDIAEGDFRDLEAPAEALWNDNYNFQHSLETLRDTDYAALDTMVIFYDAEDYMRQRSPYNPDEDKRKTDTSTVAGAYSTGIGLIREALPHVRIILVTPMLVLTYTPEGTPTPADRYDYGHGKLDVYVDQIVRTGYEMGVTVLDNYHGMTEDDNANGYLADTTHLSAAGCAALAEHIKKVL